MRPEFPPGHHTIESAAEQLGMSKRALYKRLRELGILKSDFKNGQKYGQHNLLHQFYINLGWGYTSSSDFTKRNSSENRVFSCGLAVLYPKGFEEIKKIIKEGATPPTVKLYQVKEAEKPPEPSKKELKKDFKTNLSREACLKHLQEMGL